VADGGLREGVVAAGTARLADFSLERTATALRAVVEGLLGSRRR
jgi:hypothetical protein